MLSKHLLRGYSYEYYLNDYMIELKKTPTYKTLTYFIK